jgi:bifunctional non-homologous end joining protein LigD
VELPLASYRRKRDFAATPEPGPRVGRRRAKRLLFVVQQHHARRLHWDFRLELDGVLKSWAVTREPSPVPGERRLAVQVEDHPVAYASFHGDIPSGHYGAGHVDIWDRGVWTPVGDPRAGLRDGHLDLELEGERLRGRFVLVRMKKREGEKRDNWLLIARREEAERGKRGAERERRGAPLRLLSSGASAGSPASRVPASAKPARATKATTVAKAEPRIAERRAASKAVKTAPTSVAGVVISNPSRPLAAAPGAVKADLARYYEAVSIHI